MDNFTKLFTFFIIVIMVMFGIMLLNARVKADTTNWMFMPYLVECTMGTCVEKVQEKPKYSEFREVKDKVRAAINSAGAQVGRNFVPNNIELSKKLFSKAFSESLQRAFENDSRVTVGIIFDDKYNTREVNNAGVMVGTVMVTFKDERSEISWRYDIVFEQNIAPVVIENTI